MNLNLNLKSNHRLNPKSNVELNHTSNFMQTPKPGRTLDSGPSYRVLCVGLLIVSSLGFAGVAKTAEKPAIAPVSEGMRLSAFPSSTPASMPSPPGKAPRRRKTKSGGRKSRRSRKGKIHTKKLRRR